MSRNPRVGIVAGSGIELEPLLDEILQVRGLAEFESLPRPEVSGRSGRIVEGRCAGVPLVIQCGRLHFYDGFEYEQVTWPVEVLRGLGVRTVLFTNAAGGLAAHLTPGDLMAVADLALWPCRRWAGQPEALGVDYVLDTCDARGRYMWVHGPCYETPAEVTALHALEGEAVGMSTAPEVARCRELGMRSGAISCITNHCSAREVLTHEHVLEQARSASARLRGIIRRELPRLHQAARI